VNQQDTEAKDITARKELEIIWQGQLLPKEPGSVIMGGKGSRKTRFTGPVRTQTQEIHKHKE
jgi:hypothetical protein